MPDVLILQHVRPEPPATITDALEASDISYRTVRIYRDEPVPDTLDAEGLVVMGGPMGVADIDDREHLQRELDLIDQALKSNLPLLGICLGAQLIAHVLGAEVESADEKEIGWGEVALTEVAEEDSVFSGVDSSFTAFHWHGDVFTLPDGAVRLARSAQTENQAFRYGRNAYGILFHLEVTPKTVAWMTKAFQDELAEEGLDGAQIRRDTMTHEECVRQTARTVFGRWAELLAPAPA